ncbi:Protein of unknown function [Pyronema omphalodes CBS 100304]|uniref:Uncharacterized protein n=1 Tax=Pyronema omphalodes (strain CBS 100304) TaxID=1076935 RepID=U4L2D0_PYROM|nr:Protein of unknown function [Pyronema omphalodes CBS 100304]
MAVFFHYPGFHGRCDSLAAAVSFPFLQFPVPIHVFNYFSLFLRFSCYGSPEVSFEYLYRPH